MYTYILLLHANYTIAFYRRLRYTAYRQLTRWCWHYLSKHMRVVLPSCAVNLIRRTFPSEGGNYTGFLPVRICLGEHARPAFCLVWCGCCIVVVEMQGPCQHSSRWTALLSLPAIGHFQSASQHILKMIFYIHQQNWHELTHLASITFPTQHTWNLRKKSTVLVFSSWFVARLQT